MTGFQELTKNSIVGKNMEDRFAVHVAIYGDTQRSTWMYSAGAFSSSIFARILHAHEVQRYNHG